MLVDLLLDPFDTSWAAMLETAEAAEAMGFDGLWTWDHLAGEVHGAGQVHEAWTLLSALAAKTTRVTIGPLVLNVANRRPGVLATMAATLQDVSGGRLLLGMGAGGGRGTPYRREQEALGSDVPGDAHRRRRLADAIIICRQVWTGRTEPTNLPTGELGSGHGFLRPQPPPPIIVGGFGPRVAELAGTLADGFNTQAGHPQLERLVEVARSAHEGRNGAFEVSGFAALDPRSVEAGAGRLDRLIMIFSPRDGIERLAGFASAAGLDGPGALPRPA